MDVMKLFSVYVYVCFNNVCFSWDVLDCEVLCLECKDLICFCVKLMVWYMD